MPPHLRPDVATPAASLQSWNGSFIYGSTNYAYNMVGAAPSTNRTATVMTYIIPVKIVITSRTGKKTTFDPSHVLSNGNTVTTKHAKVADFRFHNYLYSRWSERRHHTVH